MATTYRIATVADARALAQLRWDWRAEEGRTNEAQETEAAFVARFIRFVEESFGTGRWASWIAESDATLVATIWVFRIPKVPRPGKQPRDFGYVTNVYTRPEMRGGGVGSALMKAVTQWAHQVDLEMMIVWPSDRSVEWYKSHGFAASQEMLELEISGYEE